MKTYQTYLFDFDYTLADSSRGIVICFRNVLERHGFHQIDDHTIKRTIGKTLPESFSILTGITDTDILEAFRKEYVKEADQHMTVNTRLFPETGKVLHSLKNNGATIGIISTKYRYRILELVGKVFPEGFFNIIVGGLQTDKATTLYIGDSTVDAETARNAGVDFAGVLHGMTTREELAVYPHVSIADTLEELAE